MGVICCRRAVQENEVLIGNKIAKEIDSTSSKFECPYGYTGLDNMGNTCFINACLQCLSHCNPLVEYLLKTYSAERDHKYLRFLRDIIKIQWEKTYDSIVPKRILDLIQDQFQLGKQYDAHEFLTFFLNKVHEEDQFLDQIFKGELKIYVTCNQCNSTIVRYECFFTLSLAIPSSQSSLEDCIRNFVGLEHIDHWQCSSCESSTSAQKYIEFSKLPQVFIIHLKRFQLEKGQILKNSNEVNYEIARLKIDDGNKQENHYNLFGVVDHYGDLANGHYTASVLHRLNFKWQFCNDHAIFMTHIDNIISENAYILFYLNTSAIGSKTKMWGKIRSFGLFSTSHKDTSTSHRDISTQEDAKVSLESSMVNLPPPSNLFGK